MGRGPNPINRTQSAAQVRRTCFQILIIIMNRLLQPLVRSLPQLLSRAFAAPVLHHSKQGSHHLFYIMMMTAMVKFEQKIKILILDQVVLWEVKLVPYTGDPFHFYTFSFLLKRSNKFRSFCEGDGDSSISSNVIHFHSLVYKHPPLGRVA